jgi:hypothetical protein
VDYFEQPCTPPAFTRMDIRLSLLSENDASTLDSLLDGGLDDSKSTETGSSQCASSNAADDMDIDYD